MANDSGKIDGLPVYTLMIEESFSFCHSFSYYTIILLIAAVFTERDALLIFREHGNIVKKHQFDPPNSIIYIEV